MEKFIGECVGGPLGGKRLVHWMTTYKIMKPVMEFSINTTQNMTVEAVSIGEYVHADGLWLWRANQ